MRTRLDRTYPSPAERRPPSWHGAVDPLVRYPWLGTGVGLALVVVLVSGLDYFHGAKGPLGQSIPLFFLVPVLLASAVGGRRAGVLVSVVDIFAWDWYFIPPVYTVTVASARDILALVVFLAVALLTGQLATIARCSTDEALRRVYSSEALYDLSMALIARRDPNDMLPALTQRLRETFALESCAVLLPAERSGAWRTAALAGSMPASLRVEESHNVAAVVTWVDAHGQASGLGHVRGEGQRSGRVLRPRAGEERAQFVPLRVGAQPVGVLELVHKAGAAPDAERERLPATFANGVAIALLDLNATCAARAAPRRPPSPTASWSPWTIAPWARPASGAPGAWPRYSRRTWSWCT